LASRSETRMCEQCKTLFSPTGGTSGRFCSRACVTAFRHGTQAAAPDQPDASSAAPGPPDAAVPPVPLRAKHQFPQRRCARCLGPFRPLALEQRVCDVCQAKPLPTRGRPADKEELETVWRPGREAPSLSGEGLGSSLAGETTAHRARRRG